MRTPILVVEMLAAAMILAPVPVRADPVGTVTESGKTAGDAVRDGAVTAGKRAARQCRRAYLSPPGIDRSRNPWACRARGR
jgi:hypothetical protein